MDKAATKSFHDLLVTHDFEPESFDVSGREVADPSEAEMFSFDWKTQNHNYGTVVVLLGDENTMEVYYSDNLGRNMEPEDKKEWYDFLYQIKQFAKRNRQSFALNNISRLKYTMKGMAAIKEGLFEGYYGRRNVSYSDEPKQVRLMIKHNRNIPEGEARHHAIESIFVETADGERFRVPTRSLTHGKILARHCAEGGTPYDAFGQHINTMINEIGTLGRFIRATQGRGDTYSDEAQDMVGRAVRHYSDLKRKAKRMISQHGYRDERDRFDPGAITETEQFTDSIREMFTVRSVDRRVEEALPVLVKMIQAADNKEADMKEANQFESWANQVMEGTWALPDTPQAIKDLQTLMSKPLLVGADAVNATEQLYGLVGDDVLFDRLGELAEEDPDANIWDDPVIMQRIEELVPGVTGSNDEQQGVTEGHGASLSDILDYLRDTKPNMDRDSFLDDMYMYVDARHGKRQADRLFQDESNYDKWYNAYLGKQGVAEGIDGSNDFYAFADLFSHPDEYTHPDPKEAVRLITAQGQNPKITASNIIKFAKSNPDELGNSAVANAVKSLMSQGVAEDLDTDGVMMTKQSNMSSESIQRLSRLAGI